jgi:ribonuclease HII
MPGILISAEEWDKLYFNGPVIGVDEAGRGAWAGPVVVAATMLPEDFPPDVLAAIQDSKRLRAAKRCELSDKLKSHCPYGIGEASAREIDELGLATAVAFAANRAFFSLTFSLSLYNKKLQAILLDGTVSNWQKLEPFLEQLGVPWYYMIKADALVKVVSAASILAKTRRDASMCQAALVWQSYGFQRHFGYGTPEHMAALEANGISPIHRRSYRPLWRWVPVRERLEYKAKRWRGK